MPVIQDERIMKILINAAVILAVSLCKQNAVALIDCGPASVVAIQAERNSVLVKLKGRQWGGMEKLRYA